MKKLLMSLILILVCVLLVFACTKGISIGKINIKSVAQIKQMNEELENTKNTAIEKTNKEYPNALSELKNAISSLNISKNKYNEKTSYAGEGYNINTVQLEQYKIEFLWTRIGGYANKNKVEMEMSVSEDKNGSNSLSFYIVGSYINVTDFIRDVENDDELGFKISDFILLPDNTITSVTVADDEKTTTETTDPYSPQVTITTKEAKNDNIKQSSKASQEKTKNEYNPKHLEAKFKVYGVEIIY